MKALVLLLLIPLLAIEAQEEVNYDGIGCFKDEGTGRALPTLIGNYRDQITNWSDLSNVVQMCAEEAKKRSYLVFGLQFYGECWSGENAGLTYDKYGPSENCVILTKGVGEHWTNYVYRLI